MPYPNRSIYLRIYKQMENIKQLRNFSYQTIFWGWNLIFLSVFYCGILPFIGAALIIATFEGTIPFDFTLALLTLIAVPTVCTIYGVEISPQPAQRIDALVLWRRSTPCNLVSGATVFNSRVNLCQHFDFRYAAGLHRCVCDRSFTRLSGKPKKYSLGYRRIAHTLMLFTGIYLGAVLIFYAIPVAGYILAGLYHFAIRLFLFWLG